MTTAASIGYGRLLEIQDTGQSPPAFVTVGEVTAVNGPAFAADAVDATHMQSTDQFREFIGGLRDAGEISGEINYVPGSPALALALASLGRTARWRITEPGGGSPAPTVESDGILTGYQVTATVADKMTAAFTIKLSGVPVMTGVSFAA